MELRIKQRYDSLITWADLYQTCSNEERKMILSELIGRIEVYKDYELKIEFNLSYQDLFVSLFGEDEIKNLTA